MTTSIDNILKVLRYPKAPKIITQNPFDYDPGHYERLCADPRPPKPSDLTDYALDLQYMDLQPDLFLFLFPICLRAWKEDLMQTHDSIYGGFVEQFSTAMAEHNGFQHMLSSEQWDAVAAFMKDSLLEKIDKETELSFEGSEASPYRWINAIASYGTFYPTMADFWNEWWAMSTQARARGVLQYASAILYGTRDNPIFKPWTRERGGGPPAVTETADFNYTKGWLSENVTFLRSVLTPDYIKRHIRNAATTLKDTEQYSIPQRMLKEFDEREDFLRLTIAGIIQQLETPSG